MLHIHNTIELDNGTRKVMDPYESLVDYFLNEYDDDGIIFREFFEANKKSVNILCTDINASCFDHTFYVRDCNYIDMTYDQVFETKLIDYPPYQCFFDHDMKQTMLDIYGIEIKDFSIKTYKLLHKDVACLSDIDIIKEYCSRRDVYQVNVPDDFNPRIFMSLNKHIELTTDDEACVYYSEHADENLKYKYENIPQGFNIVAYKLNAKMIHIEDIDVYSHVEKNGVGNVKYWFDNVPHDFDYIKYASNYPDLEKAYGTNKYGLYLHYENHGFREGRIFK